MHPVEASERALRGSRLWVATACSAIFVVVVLFLLVDLRTSVHEARVLSAGVVCPEGPDTDCLAQEPVELGPSVFVLATYDVRVWVGAAIIAVAVWWGPAVERRLRGVGKHAA